MSGASGAPFAGEPRLAALVERVRLIGRDVIAPAAAAVDRDARFPVEAFAALKAERLLSAYVPEAYGGMGLDIREIARICEVLGEYCGSTAMVFAMHQIQVACVVHHALGSAYFQRFVGELVASQLLMASATTEVGIGGDVRSSRCALNVDGQRFSVEKHAPVVSYAEAADVILLTCRRAEDALPSDQVHVLLRGEDRVLVPLSGWDTLGFRGTCSSGFTIQARGHVDQVLPAPYAEIHARTMHAYSHTVWSALWLGIAVDAVNHARAFVRSEARKTPGTLPPSALRLAEVDATLMSMRAGIDETVTVYHRLLGSEDEGVFVGNFAFALRVNNLKVATSSLLVDVVGRAMLICGMAGYRNDSVHSLGRHLRDAYGAALMVNNDRILGQSAMMQLARREG